MENANCSDDIKIFDFDEICKLLFEDLPIGLMILNSDASVSKANNYILKFFNKQKEEVSGKRFGNIFNCNVAITNGIICGTGDACKTCAINNGVSEVLTNGAELKEVELCHDFIMNGRQATKWFTVNASRIKQDDGIFALVSFTDISNRKKAEKELIKLGITDELTGLYNRRFIMKQIKSSLETKENSNSSHSLALLDIDKFKNVNDTYGHTVGDMVLVGLAELLKNHTRDTDYVGRYGGEEFLILFNNTDIMSAQKVLSRISLKFRDIMRDKIDIPLTFSAGLIEIKEQDKKDYDLVNIINKVDKLMYQAKVNGRNRIEIN